MSDLTPEETAQALEAAALVIESINELWMGTPRGYRDIATSEDRRGFSMGILMAMADLNPELKPSLDTAMRESFA